jgi:hypothetical protein
MRLCCLGFLVAAAMGAAPGHAADDLGLGLLGCASLGVDSERLACYDRLAAGLRMQKDHPRAAVPAPPAKEVFGLKAAPERPAAKSVEHSELNSVRARVTSLRARSQGGVRVELDNGQSWEELGTTDLELEVGDSVTIARGALGSFLLTTPHKRIAKVTRVR